MKLTQGGTIFLLALLISACTGDVSGVPEKHSVPGGDADRGQTLIANYGCGACHQIKGIPGAVSQVAPPLTEYHKRQFIAGNLPNTSENLTAWIVDPQVIEPGTAMPDLGITREEALDIAAYLYNQQPTLVNQWKP